VPDAGAPQARPLTIFVAHPSALLTDNRPHGDGLIAWGYIRGLAERGHELHVAVQDVDLRATVPSNVHLYPLDRPAARGAARRLAYMRRLRHLHRRLDQSVGVDLVHQLNPVDVGMTLSLSDLKVPLVLGPYWPDFWHTHWEGRPSRPAALLKRVIRQRQQRRADVVLLSTPAAKTKLEVAPDGPVRVRQLTPGIDVDLWTPAAGDVDAQTVLFLAGLHVYKGIYVLLDAFDALVEQLPSARLLIAGSGPEADQVRRRVEASPSRSRIRLIGHLEREQVVAAMRSCGVYCLPSFGEPFGMSVLEAMACGKPVVATAAGGVAHLVVDAGGRKVTPGDPVALRDALHEILTDPELARTMGSSNRRLAQERYAWPRVVGRLEDIYREALTT
jgi:glycosyltransferase involved in cell wall biosynthesis